MHERFLLAALEQAWFGRGLCAPNPSVGAVAVQNNQIIAQSWHHGAGTPHAEQIILANLDKSIPGVTLYVTLEPCNHWGRTPPCVDMIISKGIQRVVYAYKDPNQIVANNNTPALLERAGIEVLYYPIPEINRFYASYHYWMVTKKPWVTAKIAQTFDGKIAGAQGQRIQLSNASCAQFTHDQRLHSDVILTTARTVNQDDPLLNVRLSTTETAKPVAILDRDLTLNPHAKVLTTAQHCHIFHDKQRDLIQSYANCSFHAVLAHENHLDLEMVLSHLGRLGYHDVWVEAGSGLFNALHQAGLVQRTYIYLVPQTLGDGAMAAYQRRDFFNQAHTVSWQAMEDNMVVTLEWQDAQCLPV